MDKRRIYIVDEVVPSPTPALTVLRNMQKEHKEGVALQKKLLKKYGASGIWAGRHAIAFTYKEKSEDTFNEADGTTNAVKWKKEREDLWIAMPYKRTVAGKVYAKLVSQIPTWEGLKEKHCPSFYTGETGHMSSDQPGGPGTGFVWYGCSVGTITPKATVKGVGEKGKKLWITTIHKKAKAKPVKGLVPLRVSDYYKLMGE